MTIEDIPDAATILVVDDNTTNLSVLFDLLSHEGFKVLVAGDGESAIAQVQYVQPDLLLLDVMMPGINGFETCHRLKQSELTQNIPVIFMTALSEISDKVKGFNVGAVDYITKPIDREEVLARIKTHLTVQSLQKTLQEQNLALQKEVEERIAAESALRMFLHAVSHDLRNPVTAMLMVLRQLLQRANSEHSDLEADEAGENVVIEPSTPVTKSILEKMEQSTSRQLNLINSLLESHVNEVKGIALHQEPRSLSQLVEGAISDLEPLVAENGAKLANLITSDLPLVLVDTTQLCRVWHNLISNALKHNPPGLNLTLDAVPVPSMILCSITDDGVGMTPEQCDRLFNLYSQGKRSPQSLGLGLGLYLCRQIITAHGGEIGVESQPNAGSKFWFTIPVA
jgi:two-component system, sensor histidine kinase and response regulator